MEYWHTFIRSEYANEVMIGFGGLIIVLSIVKILSNGFKMVIWVFLALLGSVSLSYGFQHSPYQLPALDQANLADLTKIASEGNSDVLRFLCERFSPN